jgi:hypothetical protein
VTSALLSGVVAPAARSRPALWPPSRMSGAVSCARWACRSKEGEKPWIAVNSLRARASEPPLQYRFYPKPAIAQGARELKIATIWPKGLPGLQSGADRVAHSRIWSIEHLWAEGRTVQGSNPDHNRTTKMPPLGRTATALTQNM